MFTFPVPPELEAALLKFWRDQMDVNDKASVDAMFQDIDLQLREIQYQISALKIRIAALELVL